MDNYGKGWFLMEKLLSEVSINEEQEVVEETCTCNKNSEKINQKDISFFPIKHYKFFTAITIGLILIIIGLFITTIVQANNSNYKIASLENKLAENIASSDAKIVELTTKVANYDSQIDAIKKTAYFTQLSLEVSEGVVTDKIVIQKANLYYDILTMSLNGTVDIRPQPSYSSFFKGQGKFDLSDREIKVMLEEIVSKLKDFAAIELQLYDINFDGGKINITQNNYSVATYENKKITLAGE